MAFYLSSVNGIAGYLKRRLETNGFSCYQRYLSTPVADIEDAYRQGDLHRRDERTLESAYLFFRHVQTENEFQSIRVSNHYRGDDPTTVANYEVFACIRRDGAISYLMLLKRLAGIYDFALNEVELKLLVDFNYRLYTAQLQKLTNDYYLNLPSKNTFCFPERIIVG